MKREKTELSRVNCGSGRHAESSSSLGASAALAGSGLNSSSARLLRCSQAHSLSRHAHACKSNAPKAGLRSLRRASDSTNQGENLRNDAIEYFGNAAANDSGIHHFDALPEQRTSQDA